MEKEFSWMSGSWPLWSHYPCMLALSGSALNEDNLEPVV